MMNGVLTKPQKTQPSFRTSAKNDQLNDLKKPQKPTLSNIKSTDNSDKKPLTVSTDYNSSVKQTNNTLKTTATTDISNMNTLNLTSKLASLTSPTKNSTLKGSFENKKSANRSKRGSSASSLKGPKSRQRDDMSYTSVESMNYTEFQDTIKRVDEELLSPMRKHRKKQTSELVNLTAELDNTKKNINSLNSSLDMSYRIRENLTTSSKSNLLTINRLNKENESMNKEIEDTRKEINNMNFKKNEIEKDKILKQNEYENIVNDIDEMRKNIKTLSLLSESLINEKRVMKSALLSLIKKNNKMKQQLSLDNQKRNFTGKELTELFNRYSLENVGNEL